MPHVNCHLIERELRLAKNELEQIQTDITTNKYILDADPSNAVAQKKLTELYARQHQTEDKVKDAEARLAECEAQEDLEKSK